jgi:hypothetical protein
MMIGREIFRFFNATRSSCIQSAAATDGSKSNIAGDEKMSRKSWLTAVMLTAAAGLSGQPAWSQPTSGVKTGILTCNVEKGWGVVFGSSRELKCNYTDNNNKTEHYGGHIDKFGVDIGYHAGGVVVWAVFSPTSDVAAGALAGTYGGVAAGAAVGIGAGANVLVGGAKRTISLQPLSIEGTTGINVAAGIAQIVLRAAK